MGPDISSCFGGFYRGKRVLVTGHTGFKGAWLTEWLLQLGADVTGFSLAPPSSPALFDQLGLAKRVRHVHGDVRDLVAVGKVVQDSRPDYVFHLAAQPLVRLSFAQPVETYATNVMGTVHVLEAVRHADRRCVVIAITTDKCYENREWEHAYREEDALGGHDPYSSSKAAAELAIAAFRRSYFSTGKNAIHVASARAGNVIGGGDWAADRIMPDCIRALQAGRPIPVRSKFATRPWQHVLEPLGGYLWLGACLGGPRAPTPDSEPITAQLATAFNFGPTLTSNRTVAAFVEEVLKHWPGRWEDKRDPNAVHEATLLNLATDRAYHRLQWRPAWDFEQAVEKTVQWYRAATSEAAATSVTTAQIQAYVEDARQAGIAWADTMKAKTAAENHGHPGLPRPPRAQERTL